MGFRPPLKNNQIRERWGESVRALALEAYGRIGRRTPVDTGNARANWHITTGRPSSRERKNLRRQDFEPRPSISMRDLQDFEPVFIQNNVPYIGPLEYGHSGQAPGGMVRLTKAELGARR